MAAVAPNAPTRDYLDYMVFPRPVLFRPVTLRLLVVNGGPSLEFAETFRNPHSMNPMLLTHFVAEHFDRVFFSSISRSFFFIPTERAEREERRTTTTICVAQENFSKL